MVTTRHIGNNQDPEKLKAYALKKSKRIEKYIKPHADSSDVRFVLSVEKFRDTAEISIKSKSLKITSSFETTDMYAAIDGAMDAIVTKLKKESDKKITAKRRGAARAKEGTAGAPTPSEAANRPGPGGIRVAKLPRKLMTVEEAVLQLEVSEAGIIAFRNSATNLMNVLYVENSGQIVLVEP